MCVGGAPAGPRRVQTSIWSSDHRLVIRFADGGVPCYATRGTGRVDVCRVDDGGDDDASRGGDGDTDDVLLLLLMVMRTRMTMMMTLMLMVVMMVTMTMLILAMRVMQTATPSLPPTMTR